MPRSRDTQSRLEWLDDGHHALGYQRSKPFAMLLIPVIRVSKRVAVEESALRDRFGEVYVAFARDRSRLIPHVR